MSGDLRSTLCLESLRSSLRLLTKAVWVAGSTADGRLREGLFKALATSGEMLEVGRLVGSHDSE